MIRQDYKERKKVEDLRALCVFSGLGVISILIASALSHGLTGVNVLGSWLNMLKSWIYSI